MIGYDWFIIKVKAVVMKVSFVSSNKSMTINFAIFFIIAKVIGYDWFIIKVKAMVMRVRFVSSNKSMTINVTIFFIIAR